MIESRTATMNDGMPFENMNLGDNTEPIPGGTSLDLMPWVDALSSGTVETTNTNRMEGEWTNWQSLGGPAISAPAAASWGENRIDIFSIGTDSRLYHKWWNGQQWQGWESLGKGTCIYRPAAVSRGENRLDVFVISLDKQLYWKSWDGERWRGWKSLGGTCIHGVAATSWGRDRIDLFTVGTNSVLYHKWGNGKEWQGWKPLMIEGQADWEKSSTSICAPAAVSSKQNRIDIFTLGIDNHVYHAWGNGETWMGWQDMGGPAIHGVAATSRGANRVDLFTVSTDIKGTDNHLYHRAMEGDVWSDWDDLGGTCISAPAAVARGENHLDTLVVGSRSEVWQKSWEGGSLRVSSSNYDSVQFIGYALSTGVFIEEIDTSSKAGVDARVTQKYLGSSDFDKDWQARCDLMEEAIKRALNDPSVKQDDGSCLKVFMAPEFYFRGPLGAYTLDYHDKIVQKLRETVRSSDYKDWLFVFGSILSWAELASGEKKEVYNTVLIQKGGITDPTEKEYEARAVIKEYKSWIDFAWRRDDEVPWDLEDKNGNTINEGTIVTWELDENALSDEDVQSIFKSEETGPGQERQQWRYDGLGIFEVDGITFGLEICLDHSKRRLRQSPPAKGQKKVQIQLIPSAGMSIQEESVIVVTDGLVFNCDGSGNGRAELAKGISEPGDLVNADIEYIDDDDVEIINLPTSSSVTNPELYFEKPGKLFIYAPQVIPDASVVP